MAGTPIQPPRGSVVALWIVAYLFAFWLGVAEFIAWLA